MKIVKRALTFEDVLLVPQYSEILPKQVNVASRISKKRHSKYPSGLCCDGYGD